MLFFFPSLEVAWRCKKTEWHIITVWWDLHSQSSQLGSNSAAAQLSTKRLLFFFLTLQQFCHWCRLVWEWGFISLACFDTNSTSHVPSEQSSRLSYLLMLRKQGQAMQFPLECFFSTVRPSFMKHVISIDLFLLYFNNILYLLFLCLYICFLYLKQNSSQIHFQKLNVDILK